MGILDGMLNQTAVYWGSPVKDKFGQLTFADPVEVDCRWEDVNDLYIGQDGKQHVSSAKVYLDQDVQLEGFLFLGELADLDSSLLSDPRSYENTFQIKKWDKISDLSGVDFVRTAWL